MKRLATSALLVVFAAASAPAAESSDALKESIERLFETHRGKVGAAAKHLDTGEAYAWNADEPMPTASLIKLPLMIAAYRQADDDKVDLDRRIVLQEDDKVPGSGVLTSHFSAGAEISLLDAIRLMIVFSDNTATNLVIDLVGLEATRKFTKSIDCPNTQLHSHVYRRDTSIAPERSREFGLGSTTAAEMIRILESLHKGELASAESSKAMLDHMRACEDRQKVPRFLPEGTVVAHKTGSVSASRCDAGIIESPGGPIAFCILTNDNEDRSWSEKNEAELLAAEFGRALYNHFNDEESAPTAPAARVLRVGDDGELVEALQRTINARTEPSVMISVDGDFGPNTEAAVKKFQKQEELEPSGLVDAKTWRALGPLLTEDEPGPPPEEVNSTTLTVEPADAMTGPPLVTSKAYAIADGETGRLLWGYNDAQQRDPASTTKMMTAYLVVKLAAKDPSVLEEEIVFSTKADETPGSTAAVRAGEKLTVGELLYGLLLPSGNDASVALAEHFGERLDPDSGSEGGAYDGFVRAMNAEADRLGMSKTTYKNTHGLTAEGHVTSAGDLAKLSHAAMDKPLLCKIVSTRMHGATLDSVSGYQRNVVWRNTNRLLGIEGFDGVKTGTTGPAGACLASTGTRDGRRLIVVVLGATSGDARYTDSRNLYRWAWRQLLKDEDAHEDQ